ncbi:hypothetical protein Pmar_PMAR029296 [Perkinsus marinus ATCC 50983]|uniref:Uncharacterized protein n=1 Tax=Perkinsus marinus (strain ATCC 50983 / TXsc) TaxID=423536 RepID=C5KMS2_PERM5|nr:hypothetical protein Pmar_PMAR029296 [Perkinsus marinus ATCC 50983]EER14230.1 hypothetical protein Pmar_PMAR029296 [Perkinsus marinus ATCC 50983]|eukprot:XP_002782435.1 hypothetical protein Pmar_PMAR029296 [Perkinsus marinus ATCC 50983]
MLDVDHHPVVAAASAGAGAAADPRVPSCHNIILWSDVMVASGSLYAYTLITFAKFWLEQDMIAASGEETNKKLNNEFIDQHFYNNTSDRGYNNNNNKKKKRRKRKRFDYHPECTRQSPKSELFII